MDSRDLIKLLEKDGWHKVVQTGPHIQLRHPSRKGRVTVPYPNFVDNGIITSLNVPVGHGPFLESFVIAEIEKRRKLGFIPTDLLYYYKNAAGHEIDLLFQVNDMLYAIEIKSTQRPGKKDIANLKQFNPKQDISVTRILFYLGEEYITWDNVQLIPVAALFRGQ